MAGNGKETMNSYEQQFASQIAVQEKLIAPLLQQIFLSKTLEEKKKKSEELAEKAKATIKSDFKNSGEFIFYAVANKFFMPGWFLSENDENNIEAALYFYSLFPDEFIGHAFEKFKAVGFKEEILHYYGRALVRISNINNENRKRTIEKLKIVFAGKDVSQSAIQAKIFASMDAIALKAVELVPSLEEMKAGEKNAALQALYSDTISLIKEK